MSTVIKPGGFQPLAHLIYAYIGIAGTPSRTVSGRKTDQAHHEGRRLGKLEGIATGVAAILNEMRCERYSKFEWIHDISPHEAEKMLQEIVVQFQDQEKRRHAAASMEGLTPDGRKEVLATYEAEFQTYVANKIADLVRDKETEEAEVQRHRKAVLDRTEEPTEADREWLEPLLEEQRKTFEELQSILAKG